MIFSHLHRLVCYINEHAQTVNGYGCEFFRWCDHQPCDRYFDIINILNRLNIEEDYKNKDEEEKKQLNKRFKIVITFLVVTLYFRV